MAVKSGYSCATLEINKTRHEFFKQIFKSFRSSDYYLQLESMKQESLVIANQQAAVNMYWSSVHTARHGLGGVWPQVRGVVYAC